MAKKDFMITSTIRGKASRRGFTLTEVLIGASLGSMVLAGVLSTFLMLGRSGTNVAGYSTMESQSRRALEELGQDLRMASDVVWNGTSSSSITLTVPDNYTSTGNQVTYAYDSVTKDFYRQPGDVSSSSSKTILIQNVSEIEFKRFDRLDNPTTSRSATKRIQLELQVRTQSKTVADATDNVLSASFILRNKLVY